MVSEEKTKSPANSGAEDTYLSAAGIAQVLSAASAPAGKYYLNPDFDRLPEAVKEELREICVPLAAAFSQTVVLGFDESGTLLIAAFPREGDFLYDEIGSEFRIRELQRKHRALFLQLETYRRLMLQQ